MRKLKTIFVTSLVLFLTSCTENKVNVEKVVEVETVVEETVVEQETMSNFSNPALMYGSDFLSFFKALRKVGNYDEMVKFTSSESIEEFSVDYVKKWLKQMSLAIGYL